MVLYGSHHDLEAKVVTNHLPPYVGHQNLGRVVLGLVCFIRFFKSSDICKTCAYENLTYYVRHYSGIQQIKLVLGSNSQEPTQQLLQSSNSLSTLSLMICLTRLSLSFLTLSNSCLSFLFSSNNGLFALYSSSDSTVTS